MILLYILGAFCFILALLIGGILFGATLKRRRTDMENKEMEAILKQYGKNKTDRGGSGNE